MKALISWRPVIVVEILLTDPRRTEKGIVELAEVWAEEEDDFFVSERVRRHCILGRRTETCIDVDF